MNEAFPVNRLLIFFHILEVAHKSVTASHADFSFAFFVRTFNISLQSLPVIASFFQVLFGVFSPERWICDGMGTTGLTHSIAVQEADVDLEEEFPG